MGRLSDAIAPEAGGLIATLLVCGLTFAVWKAMGVGPLSSATAEAETEASADAGTVAVESADLDSSDAGSDGGATKKAPAKVGLGRTYNVILITVDTLRADIGYAGYPRPISPNIDALAARSTVYDNAYAMASFTPKCLGPLMIGKYVSETQRNYEHYTTFAPSNTFLAERLQTGGARTFAALSHRYFSWKKGFDSGFDVWDISSIPPNSTDVEPRPTSEKLTDTMISMLSSPEASDLPTRRSGVSNAPRDGGAAGHFFAWIHYLDPHLPYVPHEGAPIFSQMQHAGIPPSRNLYDGEVWFTDLHIGRLLTHITAQPWATDTAIILTADHGEAFGEHGHVGHGRELWQPLVHVPLLVFIPGVQHRKIVAKRSHVDLVPTVLELMGVSGDSSLRGKSLVSDIVRKESEKADERDVYIDMPDGPFNDLRRAIITGPSPGLKLIEIGTKEWPHKEKFELYDLKTDPNELKNLATLEPARLREAQSALSRMKASIKEVPPTR